MPNSGGPFDVDRKAKEADSLEAEMGNPNFWDNAERARAHIAKLKVMRMAIKPFAPLASLMDDAQTLIDLGREAEDASMEPEIDATLSKAADEFEKLEFKTLMSDPVDVSNCFVNIQAGAGGTESCDWASMLYRMYSRWAEERGYDIELLDADDGEQAGFRSVTFAVKGEYAYGYLRGESGVHRLVRISPYDSNARRHTSFVAVDVTPEIDDDIEIDLKEGDITMETFMSGGPGGQHQNKTASGVRLRHTPTGIYAECRSERSQHKNRKTAMTMLRAKLYKIEQDKRDAEHAKHYNEKGEIAFGSQIRSYTLQPYQLVKDHRTDVEVGNANGVLDGRIDPFLEAYLRSRKKPG